MQYYGLIKQSTGEDWENANISLSTAQPSIGGSAPSLPTRLIRFKRPPPRPIAYTSTVPTIGFNSYGGQERFRSLAVGSSLRGENLDDLEEKAESLAFHADMFQKSATKLKSRGMRRRASISPPPSPPALDITVAKVTITLFKIAIGRGNATHTYSISIICLIIAALLEDVLF